MKRVSGQSTIVLLNFILLLLLLWSLMIYTSLHKGMPWYEPCGMQFSAILILADPAFSIIGMVLVKLRSRFAVSALQTILPFAAMAGLTLPILIDDSLSKGTQNTGTAICNVLLVLVTVTTARNLISLGRSRKRRTSVQK